MFLFYFIFFFEISSFQHSVYCARRKKGEHRLNKHENDLNWVICPQPPLLGGGDFAPHPPLLGGGDFAPHPPFLNIAFLTN